MKKTLIFSILLGIPSVFLCETSMAQNISKKNNNSWSTKDPFKTDVFVENFGQFDTWAKTSAPIKYAVNSSDKIFFTQQGVTFRLVKIERESKDELTASRQKKEEDREEELTKIETYFVNMQWIGCNENTVIEVNDESEGYYTFGEKGYENVIAKGYKKLTYKNIYNGIDVEYIIPKEGGIKYSIIVHPGADVSKVKMKYSGDFDKMETSTEGNIIIKTPVGDIIDHAPFSFYKESSEKISSSFLLNENTVSFQLHTPITDYSIPITIIIDPWTITPLSLTSNNIAYDIDCDFNGNVYVSGGEAPFKLAKYDNSGSFLWVFENPWAWGDVVYYSVPCVLPHSGTTFIGEGYADASSRIMKIRPNGNLQLNFSPPTPTAQEIWRMFYNHCTKQLIGFGGGVTNLLNLHLIADTNLSSITCKNFNGYGGLCCNDISGVDMDENGDFYALMVTLNGEPLLKNKLQKTSNPYNPVNLIFDVQTPYNFHEGSSPGIIGLQGYDYINYYQNPESVRSNSVSVNTSYLYTYDGRTLIAWNKTNGILLDSVIVNSAYTRGQYRTHEGIDVDECNNVYVGGENIVHVYTFNGTTFASGTSLTLPNVVYDVCLGQGNKLYVCGNGFASEIQLNTAPCNQIELSDTVTNTLCTDSTGTATVSVISGGTPPYSYIWNTGATTQTITGLLPGTYIVTVTDSSCNQKMQIDTVIVTGGSGSFSVNNNQTDNICFGGSNGSSTVTITGGGTPPFTYIWSPGGGTNATATGLGAGIYTVTITDNAGCVQNSTVTITEPSAITTTLSNTPDSCGVGGSATVNASGGTSPFTYIWSPSGGTNATATGLGGGTYTVTVTDANGCTATANTTVNSSGSVTANAGNDQSVCYGDNYTLNASGGTIYQWSPATGLSDPNIANPIANPLITTTYTVTVTDGSGCSGIDDVTVTVHPQVNPDAGPDQAICTGQEVAVMNASGGVNYSWSPSTDLTNNNTSNPSASPITTTTYSVTISDAFGCSGTDDVTISVNPIPTYSYITDSTNCNNSSNGSITITPSGGTSPYIYVWNPSVSNTNVANNIPSGTYNVTITDNNGCTTTASILVAENPSPINNTTSISETCDMANGSANVTVSGGTPPYTYLWSNGSIDSTATSLAAGTYTVTATDVNGCTAAATVNVQEIPGPEADFYVHPNILTIMDGTVSLNDNSSGNIVSWQWDFGDNSPYGSGEQLTHDYNIIGTYLVTLIVTDANGCTDIAVDTVKVKDIFTFYAPNAFSPDEDGFNDFFYPQGVNWDPDHYEMLIFDRWGNLIFQTTTVGDKWNGTVNNNGTQDDVFIDVYVYVISIKEMEGPIHEFIGRVTLVR